MPKKLALFLDGTWNDLRMNDRTNVSRLAQAVLPTSRSGVPQIVFYDEGVGVAANVSKVTDLSTKIMGGAFGRGLDRKVEAAYRFLVLNYEPGDDIYIFGFSRGAFTARSVCGMIRKTGILKREHFARCPKAFDLYANTKLDRRDQAMIDFRNKFGHDVVSGPEDYAAYLSPAAHAAITNALAPPPEPYSGKNRDSLEEIFQYRDTDFTREVLIDIDLPSMPDVTESRAGAPMQAYRLMYVGLWDTVASMGLPERLRLFADAANSRYRFHDMTVSQLVSSLRHAVSIDEKRKVFASTPVDNIADLNRAWAKARGYSVDDKAKHLEPDQPVNPGPAYTPYRFRPYQQRWFPGDHGSVGGGNPERGLSNHTLRWIAEGAAWAGLDFETGEGELEEAHNTNPMCDWPGRREKNILGELGGYAGRRGPIHVRELGDTGYERYCRNPQEIPDNVHLAVGQPWPRPLLPPPPSFPPGLFMA